MHVDVGVALIVITCLLLFVFHPVFRKFALMAASVAIGIAVLLFAWNWVSDQRDKSHIANLQEQADEYNGCHDDLSERLVRDYERGAIRSIPALAEAMVPDYDPAARQAAEASSHDKGKWPFEYPPCTGYRGTANYDYFNVPPAVMPKWMSKR